MTRILLDTHAFLWFVFDDARLSPKAAEIIEDIETTKVLSVVSLWEIVIKAQIGKLSLGMALADFFEKLHKLSKKPVQIIFLPDER